MEGLFSGMDIAGGTVLGIIGGVLLFILVFSIYLNTKIYKFLKQENALMERELQKTKLFSLMKRKYEEAKRKTNNDINLQAFIEEFISGYKLGKSPVHLVQQIKLVQTLAATSILIGVLGTFLGLVFSIKGIDESFADESIAAVLSGIHTAFYTSILGIVFSIIINYVTKIQNGEHLLMQLMLKIENELFFTENKSIDLQLVESMKDVEKSIEQMTGAFMSLKNFSEGFEQATVNMNNFNDMFSTNTQTLSGLFGGMEKSAKSHHKKMGEIIGEFQSLNKFMKKQEEVQSLSMNHLSTATSTLTTFVDKQNTIQLENANVLSEILDAFDRMSEDSQSGFKNMQAFYEESLRQQENMLTSQERFEEENSILLQNVHKAATMMKEILENTSLLEISNLLERFDGTILEMNQKFGSLFQYFDQLAEEQSKYREFYSSLNERVQKREEQYAISQLKMNEYLHTLSQQNGEMSQLFTKTQDYHADFTENNQLVAGEMKQAMANSEHIFKETDALMKEQLTTLHQGMTQFVTLSNDKMSELIYKLDDSLGHNLQKSLRGFEEYVGITNKIIDNKFEAIVQANSIQKEVEAYSMHSLQHAIESLDKSVKNLSEDADKKASLLA